MKFFNFLAFLIASLAFVLSVEGRCITGKHVLENEEVSLSSCDTLPCKLRKKSTVSVEVKFTPENDIQMLRNSVHAIILGVPFPFIGVDGNSVCGKIFDAKTGAKVACPLAKGGEYVYKDEFKVLEVYPKIKVDVVWSLRDQTNQAVACFQVPARITS
ncbi:UNVERIFIED_CONTAM: hypothetical protein PYX00_006578 [Menopon gallinae]|uniref:MD-2-related lipid-recognition domain-containing protein n=1 Tax=Menopon gallinae TaxID=328185 RepID=A0AAW2HVU6_9NEOP